MPTQRNNNRRPNGNGGATFWAVTMTVGGDLDLIVEGQNGEDIGLGVCSLCAALIPGSEVSQQLHRNFHETINGIDARTAH
jgi:hypothetical protein